MAQSGAGRVFGASQTTKAGNTKLTDMTMQQVAVEVTSNPLDQLCEGVFLLADALFRIAAQYAKVPEEAVALTEQEKDVLREPLKAYIISKAGENVKPEYALIFAALGVLLPRAVIFLQAYMNRSKPRYLYHGRGPDYRPQRIRQDDFSPPADEGGIQKGETDLSGIRTEWPTLFPKEQDTTAKQSEGGSEPSERGDISR